MRLESAAQRSFTLSDATVPASNNFGSQALAMAQFLSEGDPQPVVMHVAADLGHAYETPPGSYIENTATQAHYFAGLPSPMGASVLSASPRNMGCAGIVLEYGAGPAVKRLVMDLKPGAYQLPPCTQVRTSLIAYRSLGASSFQTVNVSITLCGDDTIANPARPVVTAGGLVGGAVTTGFNVLSPAGARWWDVWSDMYNLTFLDATAPDLVGQFNVSAALAPYGMSPLYRGYSSGLFLPSWGPVEFGGVENTDVIVFDQNIAGANNYAWVRFFLEL